MKLSEMREVLDQRGIQLTRSLGQNFLHDATSCSASCAASLTRADNVSSRSRPGAATELLLATAAKCWPSKRTRAWWKSCRTLGCTAGIPRPLTAPNLSFCRMMRSLSCGRPRDWSDWKLVANLPYSVASPILVELAAGRVGAPNDRRLRSSSRWRNGSWRRRMMTISAS